MRERIFTPAELAYVAPKADPVPSLAARFAAREAVMKAMGLGLGAFGFHDVWVEVHDSGAPWLVVTGRAAELAEERGIASVAPLAEPRRAGRRSPSSPPTGERATMIPIVTPAEMAAIDAAAPEPVDVLVARAGAAVARCALQMLGGGYGRVVNVIAGGGNNGADGRVAARAAGGARESPSACSTRRSCPPALPPCDLVIDAAYGTGYRPGDGSRRPWSPPDVGAAACWPSTSRAASTRSPVRRPATVLAATRTVTFAALKPGLLFGPGKALAGDVQVVDIGLDTSRATAHLVTATDVRGWWRPRPA